MAAGLHAGNIFRVVGVLAFTRVRARACLASGAGLHPLRRDSLADEIGLDRVGALLGEDGSDVALSMTSWSGPEKRY
jgi:hypothetical protein